MAIQKSSPQFVGRFDRTKKIFRMGTLLQLGWICSFADNALQAAKQLGVSSLDDWLKVTQRQLHPLGAARLLQAEYHNSLRKALMAVYPEHKWVDWDFHTVSRGFWRQRENRRKFAQWLEKELCITEPAQWYSITPQKVEKIGGAVSRWYKCSSNSTFTIKLCSIRVAFSSVFWINERGNGPAS
jgi:hypothetical protein